MQENGSFRRGHTNPSKRKAQTIDRSNLKVIKRSNKVVQAYDLPVIANLNPRSIYNKSDEFCTFVEQQEIDVVFMSETWERNNKSLKEIIDLQDFEIVSKVCQRKGGGGRSAVFVNKLKFEVKDLTNTVIQVPWGVEAVWCLLTPKNRLPGSEVKKIACCALYVKPGSRKKTILLDHVAEAYNVLCTKYGQNLDFVLAGDTNGLKLAPILSLYQR